MINSSQPPENSRIGRNIMSTLNNMERANNIIVTTSDRRLKQTLISKNQRREEALQNMQQGLH